MRISEMWRLVEEEFGRGYGRHLSKTHVLRTLGDRTLEQALADGVSPRSAWQALCIDLEVPVARRLGRDIPTRDHPEAL